MNCSKIRLNSPWLSQRERRPRLINDYTFSGVNPQNLKPKYRTVVEMFDKHGTAFVAFNLMLYVTNVALAFSFTSSCPGSIFPTERSGITSSTTKSAEK
mmetsp:Transcript_1060/g.1645  ORF Transcript_1060/g.1645 Transcript_1060/m.1645 type:complete len:99 (-) Transcript_1060:333-629(-)